MPQIPGYKIQSNVAFARENSAYADPRAIAYANNGMGEVADSLNRLGNQVMDIAIENKTKRDTIEATKLASEATLAFNQKYEELELNTDNPDGFMEKTLAMHDDLAKSFVDSASNAQVQEMLQQRFEQTRTAAGLQAINFGVALGQVKAVNDLDTAMNTASNVVRRNPEQYGAQKALMESMFENTKGFMKPDAELRYKQKMSEDLIESQVLGIAEKDPNAADALLKSGEYDKVLSADKQKILSNTVEAERKKQQAIYEADLKVRLSRGEVTQAELNSARANKRIDDSTWSTMTISRDKAVLEAQQEGANANAVRDALLGKGGIDPTDKSQTKAAERIFNGSLAPKLAQLEASDDPAAQDAARSLVADFVQKTGYIPKTVQGQLYAAARSGTEDQVATAADMLRRLEAANPNAVASMRSQKRELETLRVTNDLVDSGLSGQEAAKRAKELTNPIDQTTAQLREKQLNDKKSDAGKFLTETTAATYAQEAMTPSMWRRMLPNFISNQDKPVVPENTGALAAVNRDMQNLYKYWYVKTGDAEIAKTRAQEEIKKSWAVSNITGRPTLMKYAPEAVYRIPGRDPSWIKNQLLEDVKQVNKEIMPQVAAEDIVLVSDGRTESEASGGYGPTYGVMYKDKDGVLKPLQRYDGNRVAQARFAPSVQNELDKMKSEEQLQQEFENASAQYIRSAALVDKTGDRETVRANYDRMIQLRDKLPRGVINKTVDAVVDGMVKLHEWDNKWFPDEDLPTVRKRMKGE